MSLESDVQREIKKALNKLGFDITDTSQGYRRGGPRHATTRITKGTPDLYVTHARHRLRAWLEVKGPDTPVTDDQRSWHAREILAGGQVAIVRSVADAMWALHAWGVPVQPSEPPSAGIFEQFPEQLQDWADPQMLGGQHAT